MRRLDAYGPRTTMPGSLAATITLAAFEIGQYVVESPSRTPGVSPRVIFSRVTAHIDHAVDAARPTHSLALVPNQRAALQFRNRFRGEGCVAGGIGARRKCEEGNRCFPT